MSTELGYRISLNYTGRDKDYFFVLPGAVFVVFLFAGVFLYGAAAAGVRVGNGVMLVFPLEMFHNFGSFED